MSEGLLGLDDWLSKVRQNRTAVVDWEAVRRIGAELSGVAATAVAARVDDLGAKVDDLGARGDDLAARGDEIAARVDETERTLCRYTAEDLQVQLGRAMRGEDP